MTRNATQRCDRFRPVLLCNIPLTSFLYSAQHSYVYWNELLHVSVTINQWLWIAAEICSSSFE